MFHLVRDHGHTVNSDPGARTLPVLEVIHENLHAVADAAALRTLLSA